MECAGRAPALRLDSFVIRSRTVGAAVPGSEPEEGE